MTAKPDSTTKVYQKDVTIELEDIYVLNERVVEKLQSHYQDAGFTISVNVKFVDRRIKSFSTWEAFSSHKWYESEPINSITIVWEFNAMLPQYKVPQKHTLMVKMSNSMRPEELLHIIVNGNVDELEELEKNFFPVVARVDFIDRILGDELLNIVSDWVKGLKDSKIRHDRIVLLLKKNKGKVTALLNYITYFFVLVCSIILTDKYLISMQIRTIGTMTATQLIQVINSVFICAFVWITFRKIINAITDKIYYLLRNYGEGQLFVITKGDEKRLEKIMNEERNKKTGILVNVIGTILINIICGVITNKLF